jgi:tRNA (guanine37-N1)-methyltransferase
MEYMPVATVIVPKFCGRRKDVGLLKNENVTVTRVDQPETRHGKRSGGGRSALDAQQAAVTTVDQGQLLGGELVERGDPIIASELITDSDSLPVANAIPDTANDSIAGSAAARVPLHFDIFTLFPDMFAGPFAESIIRRALVRGLLRIALHNIRDFTTDRHHVCDDTPYGGGGGMVMKPEPIVRAVETVLTRPAGWSLDPADVYENLPPWDAETPASLPAEVPIILLAPTGRLLTQSLAAELAQYHRIALVCGRYEGVDERVRTQRITDVISIGDYVLSGGELAAMVIVDAVTRLLPGALGYELGAHQDSHSPGMTGLLEGPHYTRPLKFRGEIVPDILYSGHHANVDKWRRQQSLARTLEHRPDILRRPDVQASLTRKDRQFLQQLGWEE